jgi:hypothetical protein
MPKFKVRLFPSVQVSIKEIEAPTMEEAIEEAECSVDLYQLFDNITTRTNGFDIETGWAEEINARLVDPLEEDDRAMWFGPRKERGIADVEPLFYSIMEERKILPLLLGINPDLDRYISQKLSEEK